MTSRIPRLPLTLLLSLLLLSGVFIGQARAAGVAADTAPAVSQQDPGAYDFNELDENWTMRDGTNIPLYIFNPIPKTNGENFPVVIMVNGWATDKSMCLWDGQRFARRGYITIAMTARGWFRAGGEIGCMNPDLEIKDLSDVITLVSEDARFPVLKDEKGPVVGVTGYSMGGCFSYLIAPRQDPRAGDPCDPRVRAVVPMHGSFDLLFSLYPNDCFKLLLTTMLFALSYTGNMSGFLMNLVFTMSDEKLDGWQKWESISTAVSALMQQPISNVSSQFPEIYNIVIGRHMDREEEARQFLRIRSARYWCDEEFDGTVEHPFTVPMLILTGFQDDLFFANEGMMAYNSAVGPKRMIITNHGHVGDAGLVMGDRLPLTQEGEWVTEQVDNWFDHYLKGADNGADKEPRVCFYRDQDPADYGEAVDYPLPGTRQMSLFLDQGKLAGNKPRSANSSADFLINIGFTGSISIPYMKDVTDLFNGQLIGIPNRMNLFDVPLSKISYVSQPLKNDVTIMGPPEVELYYQGSTKFTQLDPFISEITPDGSENLVSVGWYEGYTEQPGAMQNTAGKPIEMQAIYHRFKAGSRIKLEIATADFPMTYPNFEFAWIWLYHNRSMPSRLILPVVPDGT
jgi:putative CocE/NonD family hydrolase